MIKSQVTLKQLEAFVQVVDKGSFRKAAAALGTTQPNVSARISALEAILDVVLMYRDAGSVRLTDIGEQLVNAARDVIRSGEVFLEVAKRHDLIEDRLRLGVTEVVACTWLHDFLRAFRHTYPLVKVALEVDLSRDIDRNLSAGHLDLAFQTAPFSDDTKVKHAIAQYGYTWFATPEIVHEIGGKPDMVQVFARSVLTHARHTSAARALEEFAESGGYPKAQIVHSNSLASCLPMAVDGMGVAMLPKVLARDALFAGDLVELQCNWAPAALNVFARYDLRRASGFILQAVEIARQVAAAYDDNEK
jgi:DNA-binding transcriptional LysR family regulator